MERLNQKLFIFDWSGVLSDDRRPVYEANMRLLEMYGKPKMTFEEWLPRTTLSVRDFLTNQGVNGKQEEFFSAYREKLNEVIREGIVATVYPEATAVLKELRRTGKTLCVVSAHPKENLEREAEEYGLAGFFTTITGNISNKTDAIIKVCEEKGVEPGKETVAYLGDTIYDVQAAKAAGVFAVAVASGYHVKSRLEESKPDMIIDNLNELI